MKARTDLLLEESTRNALWRRVTQIIEDYTARIGGARVTPELDLEKIRAAACRFDFTHPIDPIEAVDFVAESLWRYQVHTPHPRYYGLFNPAPTTMGIAADTLVAAFNPQLAAWSHSPFASEVEQHVIRSLGARFGYDAAQTDGTFASGGAEANHTALLAALADRFPDFARLGLRGLPAQPVFYVSAKGHHSFHKAARLCGLGAEAHREAPVDADLRLDPGTLSSMILEDRRRGLAPFMVVATAGTTSAGAIDPIPDVAAIADREGLWHHVDAAWGGAAVLLPELRPVLAGIERADSITFDAHKWLSVPMGAGIFLTRHPRILEQAFGMGTSYMPRDAAGLDIVDPYSHSMQWSRRFTGLKVYLSLLVAGWEGYANAIRHQVAMGDRLRNDLAAATWEVVHPTPLPIACFVDGAAGRGSAGERPKHEGDDAACLEAICRQVVSSGQAWISTARIGPGARPVLRACITNYRTGPQDIAALVDALADARELVRRV